MARRPVLPTPPAQDGASISSLPKPTRDALDAIVKCQFSSELALFDATLLLVLKQVKAALQHAENSPPVNSTLVNGVWRVARASARRLTATRAELKRRVSEGEAAYNALGYLERCQAAHDLFENLAPTLCEGVLWNAFVMSALNAALLAAGCAALCGAVHKRRHVSARYRRFFDIDQVGLDSESSDSDDDESVNQRLHRYEQKSYGSFRSTRSARSSRDSRSVTEAVFRD